MEKDIVVNVDDIDWENDGTHKYVCQECGYSLTVYNKDYNFPARKCPKGCDKRNDSRSFT